ncbi:MAG: TonB family protein [Balneolaceae bacterium]|nr:MAG: TonB family protein [Balneolaceae bacterium]
MIVGGMTALMENLQFPQAARGRVNMERVVLQALIGESGEVLDLVLLQSADCSLAQAAIYAVNQTEFTPATLDHKTIATTMNIPILFRQ